MTAWAGLTVLGFNILNSHYLWLFMSQCTYSMILIPALFVYGPRFISGVMALFQQTWPEGIYEMLPSLLSIILQRDSQDKSPSGQYLQLKTGGNLIYTVRNWAGGKLPSVSLNSSTELAVVAANGRLFHSRMDLGKKEFQ